MSCATSGTSSAGPHADGKVHLSMLQLPLERDLFLRTLIGHLAGVLEDVVGEREASGFVAVVGQRIGEELTDLYRAALGLERLDRDQVRDVCIDLKRRVQGDFYVIEEDDAKIVFGNHRCPFGEKVIGRKTLCMMTSNVFGTIAAENLGYGKVALEATIAAGDPGCRVVLYLRRTEEAESARGREYLASR